jgi:hypothetical protein
MKRAFIEVASCNRCLKLDTEFDEAESHKSERFIVNE